MPRAFPFPVHADAYCHRDLPYDVYLNTKRPLRGVETGGWTNPEIVRHFAAYAAVLFHEFGQYVPRWFTFNEARVFTYLGYELGVHPPFERGLGYVANKNVLLAHAEAVHLFRRLKAERGWNANITLVVCCGAAVPKASSNKGDVAAANAVRDFEIGVYTTPLFTGNFPRVVLQSRGFQELGAEAALTRKQQQRVQGTYDGFIGFNYYGASYVRHATHPTPAPALTAEDHRCPLLSARYPGLSGESVYPQGHEEYILRVRAQVVAPSKMRLRSTGCAWQSYSPPSECGCEWCLLRDAGSPPSM